VLLVWYCQQGTPGLNRYGPPHPGSAAAKLAEAAGAASPTAAPAPAAAASSGDMLQRLEQLGRLREQGVLTDEEFQVQKAALLGAAG
jgi:hypothetical protein